jgi:hypothetical protein
MAGACPAAWPVIGACHAMALARIMRSVVAVLRAAVAPFAASARSRPHSRSHVAKRQRGAPTVPTTAAASQTGTAGDIGARLLASRCGTDGP